MGLRWTIEQTLTSEIEKARMLDKGTVEFDKTLNFINSLTKVLNSTPMAYTPAT